LRSQRQGSRREKALQLEAVLDDQEFSEVFMMAVDGLTQDLPAAKVLRRRLEVLIDRFVHE
jgi:hypothetical protein